MSTDCTLGLWMPSRSETPFWTSICLEHCRAWGQHKWEGLNMQSNAIPLLVSLAGCPQRIPVLLGTVKEHSRKSLNRPPVDQCLLGDWGKKKINPRMSPVVCQLHLLGEGWKVKLQNRNSTLNWGEKNQLQESLGTAVSQNLSATHLKSKHTEILPKVVCRLEDVNQSQKQASPAVRREWSLCDCTPPCFLTGCYLKGYRFLFNLQPEENYELRVIQAPSQEHVEGQPEKSHITLNCCSTWLPSICHQREKEDNGPKL